MIQNKIELKLLKILDLLHDQKVRLIEEKPIQYSSLSDIHTRVEVIYDTIKRNKGRDFTPNGVMIPMNKARTGVKQ
jgi:hypothetical protein